MRMRIVSLALWVLLVIIVGDVWGVVKAQTNSRRKHNQDVRQRANPPTGSPGTAETTATNGQTGKARETGAKTIDASETVFAGASARKPGAVGGGHRCPICPEKKNLVKAALQRFWENDLSSALGCACQALLSKSNNEDAVRAILITLKPLIKPSALAELDDKLFSPPSQDGPAVLKNWEFIGPFPVGKMELDADPSFSALSSNSFPYSIDHALFDPIASLLSWPAQNTSARSELMSEGVPIGWQRQSSKSGPVDVQPHVAWNELSQVLSSSSILEFQGWLRTSTYVKQSGPYLLQCIGAHTAYVRNDNATRVVVADVYRNQQIQASLDLKAGLVGVVIPVRAVVQTQAYCTLVPAPTALMLGRVPITSVPNVVEFPHTPGRGLLLSGVFALQVHNVYNYPVSLDFAVEKPLGQEGHFFVRAARSWDRSAADVAPVAPITLAVGQTMSIALELVTSRSADHLEEEDDVELHSRTQQQSGGREHSLVYIHCRENRPFYLIVKPSSGDQLRVPVTFACRKWSQSFLFTYLTVDESVAEAAVVLPLNIHSPHVQHDLHARPRVHRSLQSSTSANGVCESDSCSRNGNASVAERLLNAVLRETIEDEVGFPVLLTLHGSGITPQNHADAHKQQPTGWKEYIFGVDGFFVVAPTRFGAHNWEGVGALTARHAVRSLKRAVDKFIALSKSLTSSSIASSTAKLHSYLPRVSTENGIISGHSMGGHGAWVVATSAPQDFVCAFPGAGWIKKEEYSNSNSFFEFDVASSFTDPLLKSILERALSEYHTDRLVNNVQSMLLVHQRVGSVDRTVHAYFARRMHRLMLQHTQPTRMSEEQAVLEEVRGKEHWWWDTDRANDGGVVNDDRMREQYERCWERHFALSQRAQQFKIFQKEMSVLSSSRDAIPFGEWLGQSVRNDSRLAAVVDDSALVNARTPIGSCYDRTGIAVNSINAASHNGLCGIRIWQQRMQLQKSQVSVFCEERQLTRKEWFDKLKQSKASSSSSSTSPALDELGFDESQASWKMCSLRASNVLRFALHWNSVNAIVHDVNELRINDLMIDLSLLPPSSVSAFVHFCFDTLSERFVLCPLVALPTASALLSAPAPASASSTSSKWSMHTLNPLAEKSLRSMGPIRQVYDGPLFIVYGTPASAVLRQSMRDMATYLANQLFAAHHHSVHVSSDVEFRSGVVWKRRDRMPNMILIGDATTNKLLKAMLANHREATARDPLTLNVHSGMKSHQGISSNFDWQTRLPTGLQSFGFDEQKDGTRQGFQLDRHLFSSRDDGIVYTLPLFRDLPLSSSFDCSIDKHSDPLESQLHRTSSLAVVVHAHSPDAYTHLSRLAWPVIPPMVRAPFANYLPDFVVIGREVWSLGPGGVRAAGFWSNDWAFDPTQAYIASDLL